MAPVDLYRKLSWHHIRHDENREAILSTNFSALLSLVFVALYVVPFYLFRKTRPSPTLNRDAPSVIKARIQTVTLTVVTSTLSTFCLLFVVGNYSLVTTLHFLGVYPIDPLSIVKSLLLTFTLFLGPLYERIYLERELSPFSTVLDRVRSSLASSQGYRNYVAGPLSEELLWRSTLIPLHLAAKVSATKITFLTPLYFGIAHVHHLYEFYLTHPDTPAVHGLLRSVFQFAYTTIFGWYASFVYLRTGNLFAVSIIHTFCNYMGLPRFWGRVQPKAESGLSPVAIRGKEDTIKATHNQSNYDWSLRHTVVYYVLLFSGAFGFYSLLFPLTEGSMPLASFGGNE